MSYWPRPQEMGEFFFHLCMYAFFRSGIGKVELFYNFELLVV